MATIRKKQPYDDYGRKKVDENLKELESRLSSMYDKAGKEITADLKTFMMKFEGEDLRKQAQVERGEITQQAYEDWKERQLFRSNVMQAKIDDLSQRMVNVDKEAMAMVNKELPSIYSTSYNFGGFRAEKSAQAAGYDYKQFAIYNKDAVRVLATEDPDLIPWKPMPDEDKSKQWNRRHIQGAVQQGILQGDSMDKIANRLMPVVNMDSNAAIRTARTAVTSVENKGRKDATERVVEAGIPMVEVWSCTHDSRTRDTHILLDGTEPNEQGLYGEGILNTPIAYPADPSGDPEEIYNCRCGLISTIKGIDHSKDNELYEQFMEDNYYEDWLTVKEQRDEKEAEFQDKKAGAAERIEARRETRKNQEDLAKDIASAPVGTVFKEYGGLTKQREYTEYHGTRAANRLNDALRKGDQLSEDQEKRIKVMDQHMENTKSPITAYRQVGADTLEYLGIDFTKPSESLAGEAFYESLVKEINAQGKIDVVDKGYMSATYKPTKDVTGIWLNINAPKGTPAFLTSNDDEYEITLGRNLNLQIIGAHIEHNTNMWGRDISHVVLDVDIKKRRR